MTQITITRVGIQGAQGEQGRVGIPFTYSTTTTQADPGAGGLRLNNAALASVTAAVLDATSAASGNPDVSDAIAAYSAGTSAIKARLRIAKASAPDEVWAEYDITSITDNGTHLSLALTYVDHAGVFTDAMATYLNFSRTGDKGEAGAVATPSETLAALLTVDGAGSGLDADLLDGNHAAAFAAASHTHLVADLSDASANGRSFLQAANYAAMVTLLGLTIGVNTQAYSANLSTWAGLAPSANAQSLVTAADYSAMRALLDLEAGTDFYSISAANSAFQPLDSDLTAIAALSTNAAGRSVLTLADPNADRLAFWDDSAGSFAWLTLGTGLSITDTTINASAVGGSDTHVQYNDGGVLSGEAAFTYNKTTNALSVGGSIAIPSGTLTTSAPALDISQTWNAGAVTFTGFKVNVTDTSSAAASLLTDWQVGGSTVASISKAGMLSVRTGGYNNPAIRFGYSGAEGIYGSSSEVLFQVSGSVPHVFRVSEYLIQNASLGFCASGGSADLSIFRDAANVLALRRSTNAQTLRWYYSYTDLSNRQNGALRTAASYVELAAETAGTGADDIDVLLTPAGTGNVRFGTHSAIAAETVTGYITIKDAGGTARKLAVVS